MNEYKKLLESENPYGDLIAQEKAQALQGAMSGATMAQPDVEAKLQSMAGRLGVVPESLRNNIPEAERQVNLRGMNYDQMARELPVATDFLAENAAVASDDIEPLSGLERTWKAFTSGIDRGSLQDELGPLHFKALTGKITPAEQAKRKELTEAMKANQSGTQIDGPLDWFLNLTGYTGRQMVSSMREGAFGAGVGAGAFGTTALIAGQAGPQIALPEEFVTVPAATLFGARAGFISATTVFNYQMEAGFAYDEYENLKDESGELLPRDVAQGAAAAVGLLNAGLETIGDLALAKLVPGLDRLLGAGPKEAVKELLKQPTFRAAIGQAGRKWAQASTVNGVTEALQELTVILGREVSAQIAGGEFNQPGLMQDAERIAQAGVEGAVGAAGVSIPASSIQAYSNVKQVQRLRANQAFMDSLAEGAGASKLRERMPEKFRDLVAKLKERGPVDSVYIPAEQFEKYFQSVGVDPAQVAEQVGATNYREAQAAGTDVVISLEDYTTYLAATEHHAKLTSDIRLHQGDLTQREYEAFEQERKEREAELMAAMEGDMDEAQTPAFEQIKQAMVGEFAGRFEPSTVDAYATTFAKAMVTMAQRAGVDPIELANTYSVRVQTPLPDILSRAGQGVNVNFDPLLDRLRTGEIPGEREAMGPSLAEFIRDAGGLQPSEEVLRLDESIQRSVGQRKLAQVTGLTADEALEAAIDAGYLQGDGLTEADLLNALADDVGGQRVFSVANENQQLAGLRQSLLELQDYLDSLGADVVAMDNAAIKAMVDEASQRMTGGAEFAQSSLAGMTREEFLGSPKIVSGGESADLLPKAIKGMEDQQAVPFLDNYTAKYTESGAVVFDGDKPIASYNFGDTLVVDKKYRKRGIGEELVYQWRSRYPAPAKAKTRTKASQRIQEKAWDRIERERAKGQRFNQEDYVGQHSAPWNDGTSAPLHDLTVVYPDDIYSAQAAQYYGHFGGGDPMDKATARILKSYRNNPDAPVKIYRAIPVGIDGAKINPGDWVTVNKQYAEDHGQRFDEGFEILEMTVKASEIFTDGNSIHEFGYSPEGYDRNKVFEQRQDDDKRGFIQIAPDRKITIALLEKANLSTFLHEMGHFHLEVMGDLAERPDASEQIKQDYATLLNWFGVKSRAEIGTEQHEMYARANEAYLMEGKAPSAELRGVFQRFRAWLTLIYRQVTALNVRLNDDVRGVFDRIYATDAEIEAASREMDLQPLFTDAAAANMTDAEFAAYKKNLERTTNQAKEDLQTQLMAEYERERQKWWKEQSAKTRLEVAAEIDAQPVYRAFVALTTGSLPDGTAIKLDKSELVRRYGKEFLKRLPKKRNAVYGQEGGTDLETAAEVLGFDNGDQLVQALANMRDRNELVKAETERRMYEQYGEMRIDGTITEKAMVAMHNESRADVLSIELRALNRLRRIAEPVVRARERADRAQAQAALDIPPIDSFRQAARGLIGQKSAAELNPFQYLTAQRRASRKSYEAAAKNNYQAAAIEKQREMMNHFLYLEAVKAKARVDKIFDYQRKFDKTKTRQEIGKAGNDYLDQIDQIRSRFEFARVTLAQLQARKDLITFAEEQEQQGLIVNVPDVLLNDARRVNYKQLTVDELNGVYDTLRNIEHLARMDRAIVREGERVEFESVRDELVQSAVENWQGNTGELTQPNRVGESAKMKGAKAWRNFDASLIKVEQMVQWLDGGKINGPWARFVFDLADKAQTKEYELHEKVSLQIQKLNESMPKAWQDSLVEKTKAGLPGFDGTLTRYTLISMALNTGNESNYQRLRDGYGWSDAQIEQALQELTADDWRFVQGVWDAVESLWPDIVELEKRMSGVAPPKVQPKPFKNQFGEFRGGYFPLAYDPNRSSIGEKQADVTQSVAQFMGNGFGRASTDKGYTKQRMATVKAALELDFERVLTGHLAKVIKDISHRESIYSLNKIFSDGQIRETMISTVGEARYREFKRWMQGLITDRTDTLTAGNTISRWAMQFRTNMAIVTMGWKISTMLAQFAGFGPSMDLVKPRYLSQAMIDYNRHGPVSKHKDTLAEFVYERSGEMKFRAQTMERDVKDALRRMRGEDSPLNTIRKTAFYLVAMADRQVTIPTWLGAYRQAIAEGSSEEDAIRSGDRAVRLSQAAGGAKDLAAVQRDNEFLRLITMYYSPFSVLYARLRDVGVTTKRVKDLPRAVARLMALVILPAVVGDLLTMKGPDEDEDEVWWAVRRSLMYPFASVPLIRDASSYLEAAFIGLTDEGEMKFPPAFKLSPIVGAMDKLARLTFQRIPEAIMGERPWDDVAWDSLEMSGYVLGLPTQQVRISGEYVADVLNDEAEIESPQQALKDLLFRRDEK